MNDARQFCTFRLGEFLMGVDARKVQEVLGEKEITPVPLAPNVVSGLINLRGQIVTVIDLRRRLGLPGRRAGEPAAHIVLGGTEDSASLLVDSIGQVLEPDSSAFEPPPDAAGHAFHDLLTGVWKLQDQLLLVLDTEKITEPDGRTTPAARP